ncbi:MAG: transcriptional regulator TetR family [Actinomycetia bacterium]|nr:transcriptional regulator TetR family [Actinomycetes bacterium]
MAFTQRSEETRGAILAAARRRFATDGYERATIRAIAGDVGIDPSMVMRYYGSKDGLFAAAVDVDLRLPDLSGIAPERLGETLVRHFLDRWEEDDVLVLLLRSAITNEVASERLRDVFAGQISELIGEERAVLLSSQLLGLALCRYVLRFPAAVAMPAETLVSGLAPTLQRYLTEPSPLS